MATGVSSGQYSPENENFCRYFRLVNETGVKPLRKIIENAAASRQMTVEAFIGSYKTPLQVLRRKGIIQKHQFDILYPSAGNFQMKNLDISLLCLIIKNTCTISPRGRTATEDLRKSRNDLCHNPVTALSRLDYDTKFSNLQNVIRLLLQECQDISFETDIEREMKNIDEGPISVASMLKLFKEFIDVQASVQDIDDKLCHLEKSVSVLYERTTMICNEYATVEKQPKLTTEAVEKIFQLGASSAQTGINPMVETLLKQTQTVLNEKSDFVITKQFQEAEGKLMSSGSVIISGGAGEGKTYAAHEIMRRKGQGNNCVQINSPSDVRFIDPRIFDFVFIDDIFGTHEVDESKLQSWIPVLETLQQLVNAKAFHLIIATREIVLKECIKSLEKFSIFNNPMTWCSRNLSQSEKSKILSVALKSKTRKCSSEIVEQCVLAFSSDLGFPYTCTLFASDDSFFGEGPSFFQHNPFMNYEIFTHLNKSKQMSLLFLWVKDGTVPIAINRSVENDLILQKLSGTLKYEKAIDVMYDDVYNNCKIMDGVLVTSRPDGYQFAHNTVYQSIGYYFARIGLYDLVIAYSNLAFFMECISVTEFRYRSDRVFIRSEFYQHLVNRIISEVIDKSNYREMAMHPCLTQNILGILIETLKRKKKLKEFFLSGVSAKSGRSDYSRYNCFLAYYVETCAAESCSFLQQVHSQLKCLMHVQKSKKRCKVCQMYLQAYHGACRGGNIEALKVLQFMKCDETMLLDAASSGNITVYEYIINLMDPREVTLHNKEAMCIAVEKQDFEMYTVIKKYGCMPESKCLLIASKAKNSQLLERILRDMNMCDALVEDKNVAYTKRTLFSTDVFNAFVRVGMCPTKEDIIRSLAADKKAVESILWDLKYVCKDKTPYANTPESTLWAELIEDGDFQEKLEEIGVLGTSDFLGRQIQKGNIKIVDDVLKQLIRKKDWNPQSTLACNFLNSCLPSQIDMFEFLIKCNIIPTYATLYKSVSTENVDVVKMTVTKMKEAGQFDSTHKSAKNALLQATFICDIYNYLIDEGMKPNAYHFLFAVECEKDSHTKIKVIRNLYSVVEKCKNAHSLKKDVMHMALLGSFNDTDVYNWLQTSMFQLPPQTLPVIASRGCVSVTQIKRLIETLKDQKEWPPSCSITQMTLQCSFYRPDIFEVIMSEIQDERKEQLVVMAVFSILLACRKQTYYKVEEYISILKRSNSWDPNDIVLKCALLESNDDEAACDIFKRNGVVADGILIDACSIGNIELQSYITAYLTQKGQTVINFKTLSEDIIRSLSAYPGLCSEQLLDRAVIVSDGKTVLDILLHLRDSSPEFIKSDAASTILEKSSNRLEIYEILLQYGLIPTADSLLNVLKNGSFELFHETLELLDQTDRLSVTNHRARELVRESSKRSTTHFYTALSEHGIKSQFEDIIFAVDIGNVDVCSFLINDLENEIVQQCSSENVEKIIIKYFQLYEKLRDKGLQVTSSTLLNITHAYRQKQVELSDVETVYSDFFSSHSWSFDNDIVMKIHQIAKCDRDLFSVLNMYIKSSQIDKLLNVLLSRDKEELKKVLNNNDIYYITNALPEVLRQALVSESKNSLDKGCMQIIFEWIDSKNCGPSLKLLSCVLKSDTDGALQVLYGLSEEDKGDLDTSILETAVEEAMFMNQSALYVLILKECRVRPTTYCLLYCVYHNNEHFNITLNNLPAFKKSCYDPYYKSALSLCCERSDHDKFLALLNACKYCDAELLYEAVLHNNTTVFQKVKEILMKNDQWDFSLKEYWISSALIEVIDNPSFMDLFESYYDDVLNVADNGYIRTEWNLESGMQQSLPDLPYQDEDDTDDEDMMSEHEYEEIDSFVSYENAFMSLKHVNRDCN